MDGHKIWCCGKDEFLVFDDVGDDWCGPFKTLEEAEEFGRGLKRALSNAQRQTLKDQVKSHVRLP